MQRNFTGNGKVKQLLKSGQPTGKIASKLGVARSNSSICQSGTEEQFSGAFGIYMAIQSGVSGYCPSKVRRLSENVLDGFCYVYWRSLD